MLGIDGGTPKHASMRGAAKETRALYTLSLQGRAYLITLLLSTWTEPCLLQSLHDTGHRDHRETVLASYTSHHFCGSVHTAGHTTLDDLTCVLLKHRSPYTHRCPWIGRRVHAALGHCHTSSVASSARSSCLDNPTLRPSTFFLASARAWLSTAPMT